MPQDQENAPVAEAAAVKPQWKSAAEIAKSTANQALGASVQTVVVTMPPVFIAVLSKALASAAPNSSISSWFAMASVIFFTLAAWGAKGDQKSIRKRFNKAMEENVTSPREKAILEPLHQVVNQRPEKDMSLLTWQDLNPKKKPASIAFGVAALGLTGNPLVGLIFMTIAQCGEEYWQLRKIRNKAISLVNE